MRELSQLKIQLRMDSGNMNESLDDYMHPSKMRDIIAGVKNLCGFDQSTKLFETPSLAKKLGYSLKACAAIRHCEAIEDQDHGRRDELVDFIALYDMLWQREIIQPAEKTLTEMKRNTYPVMPTQNDILKLNDYMRAEAAKHVAFLETGHLEMNGDEKQQQKLIKDTCVSLSEVTLAQVICFNRRRSGEVSKMEIDDFNKKSRVSREEMLHLTKLEKVLCRMFESTDIIGKCRRSVPVMFSQRILKQISLLIAYRSEFQLPISNRYLFPYYNYQSMGHIRGCDALKHQAVDVGLTL